MNAGSGNHAPRWLWAALLVLAAATLVAELFVQHHAAFGIDGSYAFHAWYTVAAGLAGVLVARLLAALLGRPGDEDA